MSDRLWIPEEVVEEDAPLLRRLAESPVWDALTVMPVVVLTGPPKVGKTTLVHTMPALRGHQYVTLEDLAVRTQAREEPEDLVRRGPRMIIDDALREEGLISAVRDAVDEQPRRRAGHFVLTASADPARMKRVHEALAGRAAYVPLWPLTRSERYGETDAGIWSDLWSTPSAQWFDLLDGSSAEPADWRSLAWRGGYPTPARELATNSQRETWYSAYLDAFLTRELPLLYAVEHVADFRRLMRVAARRVGRVMNKSDMAREAGLTQPTAHRYLGLLETAWQMIALEAFTLSRGRSLVKSAKAYWSDPGFAIFLAEETEPRTAHLENLVLNHLLAWRDSQPRRPRLAHWRTRLGEEVDFVIERSDELLAVDVARVSRPQPPDARGLRAFRDEYGERVRGLILLHTGEETFWIAKDVLATPWWRVM